MQLEQAKSEFKAKNLQQEAQIKKELMDHEFEINVKLRKMEASQRAYSEDRKDIRENKSKKFESSGNDIIGDGLNMNQF